MLVIMPVDRSHMKKFPSSELEYNDKYDIYDLILFIWNVYLKKNLGSERVYNLDYILSYPAITKFPSFPK